jgi:hypothetical protein
MILPPTFDGRPPTEVSRIMKFLEEYQWWCLQVGYLDFPHLMVQGFLRAMVGPAREWITGTMSRGLDMHGSDAFVRLEIMFIAEHLGANANEQIRQQWNQLFRQVNQSVRAWEREVAYWAKWLQHPPEGEAVRERFYYGLDPQSRLLLVTARMKKGHGVKEWVRHLQSVEEETNLAAGSQGKARAGALRPARPQPAEAVLAIEAAPVEATLLMLGRGAEEWTEQEEEYYAGLGYEPDDGVLLLHGGQCFDCGEVGHIAAECRQKRCLVCGSQKHAREACAIKAKGGTILCGYCSRLGHVTEGCQKKRMAAYRETRVPYRPSRVGATAGPSDGAGAPGAVPPRPRPGPPPICFTCSKPGHLSRNCPGPPAPAAAAAAAPVAPTMPAGMTAQALETVMASAAAQLEQLMKRMEEMEKWRKDF